MTEQSARMKPQERYAWIRRTLRDWPGRCTNILDADFVDAYEAATAAKVRVTRYGANKCPQLGRDLAAMERRYLLRRNRAGLGEGAVGQGFPSWVYTYDLVGG